jgi:3-phenylpropionate/trans-cinnamate dioxygenase ferredoxin reductase component
VYVHEEAFYADHDIELRLGRTAVTLDPVAGEVALDDGERLRYDRLLLATGAEPRRLPVRSVACPPRSPTARSPRPDLPGNSRPP